MEVRSWNERAIKAYKKVGFEITNKESKKDHDGNMSEFVVMEYKRDV